MMSEISYYASLRGFSEQPALPNARDTSAFAVLMVFGTSTLNVVDGKWTLSDEKSDRGGVVKNQNGAGAEGTINITETKMRMNNISRGFTGGTVTLNGVDMTITGSDNGINGCSLHVKNSTRNISDGTGRALTINGSDDVVEDSVLDFSGNKEADILFRSDNSLSLDTKSIVRSCEVIVANGVTTANINGTVITGTEENKTVVSVEEGKVTAIPANANVIVTAKDGTETYKALVDAVSEAQDGDTIKLLKDVEIAGQITVDKALTIDGNGHSITAKGAWSADEDKKYMLLVTADNVTVKDTTFKGNGKAFFGLQFYCAKNGKIEDLAFENFKLGLNINDSQVTAKGMIENNQIVWNGINVSFGKNIASLASRGCPSGIRAQERRCERFDQD